MAERRRGKKLREELKSDKILKEEYAVAKYLKQKLPTKNASLLNNKVEYFIASKAVDCLLDSKWATKSKNSEALFTTRESVVRFLDTLLIHNFFHRAKKLPATSKDPKKKKKEESSDEKDSKKRKKKPEKETETDSKSKTDKKKIEEKKKKKKVKLDMHLDQLFADGTEYYVWIYDPIPTKAWLIGGFLVIGAILLCLFPLWPQTVRKGVYYFSVAAAAFLVFILLLVILRGLIFVLVWAVTFGKHHFWFLPNLTEDVGFFESFWPLYKYEYRGATKETSSKDEKKKSDENGEEEGDEEKEESNGSHKEEKREKTVSTKRPSKDGDQTSEDNEFEVLDVSDAPSKGASEEEASS